MRNTPAIVRLMVAVGSAFRMNAKDVAARVIMDTGSGVFARIVVV